MAYFAMGMKEVENIDMQRKQNKGDVERSRRKRMEQIEFWQSAGSQVSC